MTYYCLDVATQQTFGFITHKYKGFLRCQCTGFMKIRFKFMTKNAFTTL